MFTDRPSDAELEIAAVNAPRMVKAFLLMHQALRRSSERLASLDEALDRPRGAPLVLPWEEVRDFFHYCDNYIDAIDRAAEQFVRSAAFEGRQRLEKGAAWLRARHGIRVGFGGTSLRHFSAERRELLLADTMDAPTHAFQLAHQIALLEHSRLLEQVLDQAHFATQEARDIARVGLANYFAGAAMMPYNAFRNAAEDERHDLDRLAHLFGASIEQVAHRLSTLQRPGAKGIPFFFARVDQAGTITKTSFLDAPAICPVRFGMSAMECSPRV